MPSGSGGPEHVLLPGLPEVTCGMARKEDAEILKMPLSRWARFCIHLRPPVKGRIRGRMPEWSIGADCKSAGLTPYEGSNPSPTTIFLRSFQSPVPGFQNGSHAELQLKLDPPNLIPRASHRDQSQATNPNGILAPSPGLPSLRGYPGSLFRSQPTARRLWPPRFGA